MGHVNDTIRIKTRPNGNNNVPKVTNKVVKRIVGITESNNERRFLVEWIGIEEQEFVSTKIVNILYPQHVIKFYEAHIEMT